MLDDSRCIDLDSIVPEIWKMQSLFQMPAVSVRVASHAPVTSRRKVLEFTKEGPILVKEFFRLVAAHPVFQLVKPFRVGLDVSHRDLVRPPETFKPVPSYFFRSRPSLGTA